MRPCMASPSRNSVTIETKRRPPRIQRFCIMWPAPGISQPTAGASTDMTLTGSGVALVLSVVEFAILDGHNLALDFPGYFGRLLAHQHIHFAAHAKLRQVDAGLNREAGVGKDLPLVVNFKVVHVGPVGMDVGADGMSRAMNEIVAVAGLRNMPASHAIHFPSRDAAAGVDTVEHGLHAGVARIADNLENFAHAWRRRRPDKSHPGDVVVHGTRRIFLSPDIE